jgi:hypothetical protein
VQKLESGLDLPTLAEAIRRLSFWKDGAGVEMSVLQFRETPKPVEEALRPALLELSNLQNRRWRYVMVNRLKPEAVVKPHKDIGAEVERWHLPVLTNPGAYWWDEREGEIHMEAGFWWGPVPYSILHSVGNEGSSERVHIIVDLEPA